MKVVYKGTADVRRLSAADFRSIGLEGKSKVEFRRNEVTEVDDEVGEMLVSKEGIFTNEKFEEVTDEEEEADSEEEVPRASRKSTKKAADSGTVQGDTGGPAAPAGAAGATTGTTGTTGRTGTTRGTTR